MSSVPRRRGGRGLGRNLRALAVAQFVNTAGLMMLVPIMPLHMEALGVRPEHVGLWAGAAIAAPALPLALTTVWWGRLGDRVGPKWMVVRALLGLAAAMAIMSIASSPGTFVAGRLVQGTFGGVVEAAAAFVAADTGEEERGTALGRSYSAMAAGSLVGPLAGGLLVGSDGLPLLMAGFGAVALLLAAHSAVRLQATMRPGGSRAPRAKHSGRRWMGNAIRTLRARILLAGFVVYFGIYGLIPVYPPFVEGIVTDPAFVGPWVGALHAIMWAGTLLGSTWWGRRNDRTDSALRAFAVGAVLTSAAIGLQVLIPHPLALAPLRFVQGWGFAAFAQSLILYASRRSPAELRSSYTGLTNSLLLGGQFAGPLAAGAAVTVLTEGTAVMASAAVVAAAAALLLVGGGLPSDRMQRRPGSDAGRFQAAGASAV